MRVRVRRVGGRRLEVHGSEASLVVDRPVEEGGLGPGFRSGELLLASLGTCMAGTMIGFAQSQGLDVGEVEVVVTDEVAQAPERITAIAVEMRIEGDLTERQLESLRRVASRCKVHNTLADPPSITLEVTTGTLPTRSRRRRPESVVSPDWLEGRLADPTLRILQVSFQPPPKAGWFEGHIPGSSYVYWKDLCWDEGERQFPSPEEMSARLGRLGVGEDTTVVLVGDPIQFATYAYWVLAMTGLEDAAVVLDGGHEGWVAQKRPVTDEAPDVAPTDGPRPGEPDPRLRVGRDDVLAGLGDPARVLVDLRSGEEYRGERVAPLTAPFDHGAERAGHIPGARHLPHDRLLRPDGSFRAPEEIEQELAGVGAGPGSEVVTYCRLSHRASMGWFLLTRVLGWEDVRVYDGSWTEWGSMVGMPIERRSGSGHHVPRP